MVGKFRLESMHVGNTTKVGVIGYNESGGLSLNSFKLFNVLSGVRGPDRAGIF